MAKKFEQRSVRLDEQTDQLADLLTRRTDKSFSELVRVSLCLAAPMLLASPFIGKIDAADLDVSVFCECKK
jgi:hypothetical protein